MRKLSLLVAICVSFSSYPASAEIEASTEEAAEPWTSLQPLDDPEDFYFAVVTDRTGSHRDGVFPAAMDKLKLIEPAFVVSVGDFIEGYTENPTQLDAVQILYEHTAHGSMATRLHRPSPAALGIEPRATGAILPRPEGRGLPRSQIKMYEGRHFQDLRCRPAR